MGNQCGIHSSQVHGEQSVCQQKVISCDLPIGYNEIDLLRNSWEVVGPKWESICVLAFQRWFTLYPDIAVLFGTIAESEEQIGNLINVPAVKGHAVRFKILIDKILTQVDEIDKLTKTITDYGKFHHSFGAEQQFATCLATSLKFAVCETSKCDLSTANAWDSLFQYLSGSLRRGIRLAREEETRKTKLTPGEKWTEDEDS